MTEDTAAEDRGEIRSPRVIFAQRFAELYAAAGNPTLRRVANAAESRMRAAQGARHVPAASAQRISDWKAGRNVPARFESLLPVVLALIDLAKKVQPQRPRLEVHEWQRLWQAAITWTPDDDQDATCPYLGLAAYRGQDRELFFGRSRPTTELTELIRSTADTAVGIIVLIGASGAGKSSLVAAGLMPALIATGWSVATMTPGSKPLSALAKSVPMEGISVEQPIAERESAPDQEATHRPGLLVVDQFEELFTVCDDEREREAFLTTLHRWSTRPHTTVVIALRADFYAQCLTFPELQDALEHRSYLLGPMRQDELAQALTRPAEHAGLELESGLEELVITELCGVGDHENRQSYDPGALPLLSHVMAATWQHREGRKLTVAGYRKAGGVVGSVAATAEQAWSELSDPQQTAAKDVLLGLVAVAHDSRDTRRIAARPDLLQRTADPVSATAALELLARTRLITMDSGSVHLTHEIVLDAWPRLRSWIDEDRVGYLVRQRLESEAVEWDSTGQDPSLLYRGTRLEASLDHVDPPIVGGSARAFLHASRAARTHSRRRSSRTRIVLAMLGVALLVLGVVAYTQTKLTEQQRNDKDFGSVLAEADRLRTIDPTLSAQLYLVADQLRPGDPEIRARVLGTQNTPLATPIAAHDEGIRAIAYRRDGKVLASASHDNTIRLWDVSDPQRPKALGQLLESRYGAYSMAFSPDGNVLATTATAAAPQLWDVHDPGHPRLFGSPPTEVVKSGYWVAFAPSGRTVAVGSPDNTRVTLWDIADRGAPRPRQVVPAPLDRNLASFTFSQNGRLLAVATSDWERSTSTVELWSIAEDVATRTGTVFEVPFGIELMRFSPDDTILALTGIHTNGPLNRVAATQLWALGDPTHPLPIGAPLLDNKSRSPGEPGLAFSPDGRTLAIGGEGGAQLWNITDAARPTPLGDSLAAIPVRCLSNAKVPTRCTGATVGTEFSADGKTLAIGSAEGIVRLWSLAPAELTGHTGWGRSPQFDAAGERMVTDSSDGRFVVWDSRNPGDPVRVAEFRMSPGSFIQSVSNDGKTLLVHDETVGTAKVIDLSDLRHIRPLSDWRALSPNWGPRSFDRDWNLLVTLPDAEARTFQIVDVSDRTRPVPLGTPVSVAPNAIIIACFNPTGTLLAVAEAIYAEPPSSPTITGTRMTLWDMSNPARPVRLGESPQRPASLITSLLVHPDGRTVVTWGNEAFQVWDISNPAAPAQLGDRVSAHNLSIVSMDFSRDGRTLATSGTDGSVRLWDFSDRTHPRPIGSSVAPPGVSPWVVRFHPHGSFLAAASKDGARRLWDLDLPHAIDRICTVAGTAMTPELWQRYLPQLPYRPPCT
ncbi:hypothetical protein [Nocardia sp. NPDC057440]|uniref:nSTAND1 domain-containing NTPase n=1 Tax=Nocardia sp. NPDC057440 TaxID=3346134 RepID=UPI0036735157